MSKKGVQKVSSPNPAALREQLLEDIAAVLAGIEDGGLVGPAELSREDRVVVAHVLSIYACYCDTAIERLRAVRGKSNRAYVERNITYWINVRSGLRWVRGNVVANFKPVPNADR